MPFPVQDRDVVFRVFDTLNTKENSAHLIRFTPANANQLVPKEKGFRRATIISALVLDRISASTTKITLIAEVNPKGQIPKGVRKMYVSNEMLKYISRINSWLQRSKRKNAESLRRTLKKEGRHSVSESPTSDEEAKKRNRRDKNISDSPSSGSDDRSYIKKQSENFKRSSRSGSRTEGHPRTSPTKLTSSSPPSMQTKSEGKSDKTRNNVSSKTKGKS